MMISVALLAMALAAAAGHRSGVALVAAAVCAVIAVTGLAVFESTVHRDHTDHHETPHLLSDSYVPVPPWKAGVRPRRLSGEKGR
jgi:hypothetical protein